MRKAGSINVLRALVVLGAGVLLAGTALANKPASIASNDAGAPPVAGPDDSYPAILIVPTSKAARSDETADLNRTICRMGPPPTGSRLGAERECHTEREWNDIRQEQWGEITRFQLMPTQTNFMHDCCEFQTARPPIGQ